MTELEKLKSGLEYCYDDAEVAALKERAIVWCREYNAIDDTDYAAQRAQLEKMLGAIGEKVWIGKVFNCDNGTVGAAGLDVYEEESEWFYEDRSDVTRQNKTLSLLVSLPNVIVTSHQAFLTHEALANIATTTLKNLDDYFAGAPLENEICYRCLGSGGANKSDCPHRANGRCHSVT
ncbi:MAG: hypothetical protein II863_02440 [Kiritimatiellae bacterium]|jgi:hypothetical protein|nr:hypothetical protein [Kiritimatiellia bacterium]MBQ3746255.1 hypothetical protein [Kiritimatiellia bacterium]